MLIVDGGARTCCRIGVGQVCIGAKHTISIVVVGRDLLGFDLLLGLDAIKQLGGVTVTGAGEVMFPQCNRPNCAA